MCEDGEELKMHVDSMRLWNKCPSAEEWQISPSSQLTQAIPKTVHILGCKT
jgi:hypothetical protein